MDTDIKKSFKQECKIINLELEYEGYVGKERYAIITDLSEDELYARYAAEIECYKPFVILTRAMGLAMRSFQRNEEKYQKRCARGEINITCNVEDEALINGLSVEDDQDVRAEIASEFIEKLRINEVSHQALMTLSELQRNYLIQHFVYEKSYREIARDEGKNKETIRELCESGLAKYIEAVNALEVE